MDRAFHHWEEFVTPCSMTHSIRRCIVFLSLLVLALTGGTSLAQTSAPVHGEKSSGTGENRESQGVKGEQEIGAIPGSKIYHLPTCSDYSTLNVKDMTRFKTEEETRRTG